MLIFIDTNIYFDHWFLKSPQFRLLASYCNRTSATLLVSQVVVEEVEAKYAAKWNEFEQSLKDLPRRFEDVGADKTHLPPVPPKPDYAFANVLRHNFNNLEILPYEGVPHKALVEWAIHARRPFNDKEKGYRDALMWHSLLGYLTEANRVSPVAFINANSRDFHDPTGGSPRLHPDLLADLAEKKIGNQFLLYPSLRAFNEANANGSIAGFDAVEFSERYQSEIEEAAEESVLAYLNGLRPPMLRSLLTDAGCPARVAQSVHDASWRIWEGVEDFSFLSFTSIDKNKLYIAFEFNIRILELQIEMSPLDYLANQADLESEFLNVEVSEQRATMETYVRCDFKAGMIFNTTNEGIEEISIDTADIRQKKMMLPPLGRV